MTTSDKLILKKKIDFFEAIQKRYGYTKDHAEQQIDDFKKNIFGEYHKDLDHQYRENQLNSNDLHGNWDTKKKIKEHWKSLLMMISDKSMEKRIN